MKNLIFILLVLGVISSNNCFAKGFLDDVENVQKYNPDGMKYAFVKNYLISLKYLKVNEDRDAQSLTVSLTDDQEIETVEKYIDTLIQNNMNLRIARNFLIKYNTSDNGLILKVVELFKKVCNEQIEFNSQEKALFAVLHHSRFHQSPEEFDKQKFLAARHRIVSQKHDSLQKLLEASMYIKKILISSELDEYGEFVNLGITGREQDKLLERLDEFYGEKYEGELREGQSFLQGSISEIREILEDFSWDTKEE